MKKIFLLVSFLVFGFGFGQSSAEIDNGFNIVDNIFHTGGRKMIKQSNGKFIVLGGGISAYKNFVYPASSLYRLNADFTPDTTFNVMVINNVYDFDVQSNDKIIIVGNFSSVNGVSVNKIARLDSNGFFDSSFIFANTTGLANFTIYGLHAVKILSSGKILVGGKVNISGKGDLFRLNSNGTFDNTFSSGVSAGNNTISYVIDFEIDTSGKIVYMTSRDLDGLGTTVNDVVFNVGRRLANGTNDTTFNIPNTFFSGNLILNGSLPKIRFQNDGKIVIKTYYSVGNSCWRLTASGTLDTSFTVPICSSIDYEILDDGNFLLVNSTGGFSVYNAAGTLLSSNTNEENIKISKIFLQPSVEVITSISWEVPPPQGITQTAYNSKLVVYNQSGNLIPTTQKGTYYAGKKIIKNNNNEILVLGNIKWDGGVKNHFGIKLLNNQGELVIHPNLENFLNNNIDFNDKTNYIENGLVQSDGKIILLKAKRYTNSGGNYYGYDLIRINSDYTVDTSFITPYTNFGISSNTDTFMTLDGNNKLLLNNVSNGKIMRLNSDGSPDYDFVNNQLGFNTNNINCIKVLPNGKILVSGQFTGFDVNMGNPTVLKGIVRLNNDGAYDPTFNTNIDSYSTITAIDFQSDGKIIIAGDIRYNNVNWYSVSRLNQDGILDTSFNSINYQVPLKRISTMKTLPDNGVIAIMNEFYSGTTFLIESSLLKLSSNGTIDTSFNIGTGFNSIINDVLPQSDGRILVTGDFDKYNDIWCNGTIRLIGNYNPLTQTNFNDISKSNIILFPNPVENNLNISKKEEIEISSITIYNMLGQIVVAIPNAKNVEIVDVSSLKSGNYFVKINSDKGNSNTKFIKL